MTEILPNQDLIDFSHKNVENIHEEIMSSVNSGVSYIESIVEYAEKHDIDIEAMGEIIKKSNTLKEAIRVEAIKNLTLIDDGTGGSDEIPLEDIFG